MRLHARTFAGIKCHAIPKKQDIAVPLLAIEPIRVARAHKTNHVVSSLSCVVCAQPRNTRRLPYAPLTALVSGSVMAIRVCGPTTPAHPASCVWRTITDRLHYERLATPSADRGGLLGLILL